MKSRYLVNLLLVMIVLGLYWFNNQPSPSNVDSYPLLTNIAKGDINTITITRANNTIELKKQGNGWQLIRPLSAKANDTRIQLILSLLSTTSFAQLMPKSETELSRFEINDSSPSLKLNDQLFQFGAIESLSKHRYIIHNGTIHLIDDQVTPLLNANASSFIENRLLSLDNAIEKLSLPTLDADNQLSKKNITIAQHNGHWQTNDLTLSADALTGLIQTWQYAYATQVLPITNKEQTSPALHTIEISFENEPAIKHLSLLVKENSLSIIDFQSQLAYQFPISMLNQLFPIAGKP